MIIDSFETLRLEYADDGRVAVIVLDRPPVNAFITRSYLEISEVVARINADEQVAAAVLVSDGRLFSAGADVKQLASDTPVEAARRRPILRAAGFALGDLQVPLVVGIHGAAVGAGAVFAAAGDVIIASPDASLSLPEINVSVVGGAAGLRKLLPEQVIRYMALTGDHLNAEQALQFGAVARIVEKGELRATCLALGSRIAEKGVLATRKWKESLNVTQHLGGREGLLVEQCLGQELTIQSAAPTIGKDKS